MSRDVKEVVPRVTIWNKHTLHTQFVVWYVKGRKRSIESQVKACNDDGIILKAVLRFILTHKIYALKALPWNYVSHGRFGPHLVEEDFDRLKLGHHGSKEGRIIVIISIEKDVNCVSLTLEIIQHSCFKVEERGFKLLRQTTDAKGNAHAMVCFGMLWDIVERNGAA